jgi:hypothetical protein
MGTAGSMGIGKSGIAPANAYKRYSIKPNH